MRLQINKGFTMTPSQQIIFISIAFRNKDECWGWPNYISPDGYARLRVNGKMMKAHRYSLELAKGPPTRVRRFAAHDPLICNNSKCFNPEHLRWASKIENERDKKLAGTKIQGEKSPLSKLSKKDVIEIRVKGLSSLECSKTYNISRSQARRIISKKSWKHI